MTPTAENALAAAPPVTAATVHDRISAPRVDEPARQKDGNGALHHASLLKLRRTVRDRITVIAPYIQPGKLVLDLGCVDARPSRHDAAARIEYKPNMLHKRLAEINKDVLGVDIDAAGIKVLAGQGYNVIYGDGETMDLNGRRFDTVIAGDIIEHLENPGQFLRNVGRHLNDDGTLIISTPNPFYVGSAWKIWRYGRPAVHEDHLSWQDPSTLEQLLRRTGFEPFDGCWVQPPAPLIKTWKRFLRRYFSHTFMILSRPAK
jgi:2-polyprenyl-3-methyl-5-hydroxy-6-metoxy-1,4-benzoquinol methylase